jgi:hypothetical protein
MTTTRKPKNPPMVVRPPMQRRLYEAAAPAAIDTLIHRLQQHREELIELGARRAFDEVGVDEYGDTTWHMPRPLLLDEADAELADAIFYIVAHQQYPVVEQLRRDARDAR